MENRQKVINWLAVILVIFIYPLGIILLWSVAVFSKKTKIFLTFLPVLLILILWVVVISPSLKTTIEKKAAIQYNIKTDLLTEDISNWKTYKSEEYNFEFKYPDTLHIREGTPNYPGFYLIGLDNDDKTIMSTIGVNIPNIENTVGEIIISEEDIIANGVNGKFQLGEDKPNFALNGQVRSINNAYFKQNGNLYSFSFRFPKDGKDYKNLTRTIISTFKLNN